MASLLQYVYKNMNMHMADEQKLSLPESWWQTAFQSHLASTDLCPASSQLGLCWAALLEPSAHRLPSLALLQAHWPCLQMCLPQTLLLSLQWLRLPPHPGLQCHASISHSRHRTHCALNSKVDCIV